MNLSIVIPAYNEEKRLGRTLAALIAFLQENYDGSYEIVIVNDGSSDKTADIVSDFSNKYQIVRLVDYPQNRGRGYAVRIGMQNAKGEIILETDADGSVQEDAIIKFLDFFKKNPEVGALFGSRNCKGSEILTAQPLIRIVLGEVFLVLAKLLFGWSITDFTLGFKMFRRDTASDIFEHQHENSFVAEAEIVVVTKRRGRLFKELPVSWKDYRNSRVKVISASINSFAGLMRIYFRNYKDEK